MRAACRASGVAAIAGLEWVSPLGLENRAFVVGPDGAVLGHQTKNQITPGGESEHYVPDGQRRLFRLIGADLRHRHLPRGLALPGDGALGRRARGAA